MRVLPHGCFLIVFSLVFLYVLPVVLLPFEVPLFRVLTRTLFATLSARMRILDDRGAILALPWWQLNQ